MTSVIVNLIVKIPVKVIVTLAALLLSTTLARAEHPQGYLVIVANPEADNTEMPFFDKPNGEKVGSAIISISLGTCLDGYTLNNKRIKLQKFDAWWTGKCPTPTYYDIEGSYVQILANSIYGGLWIDMNYTSLLSERNSVIFGPVKWMDSLIQESLWKIRGYDNYRLRTKPGRDGKVLMKLRENRHIIKNFTGNVSNNWAEVIIYEVPEPPDGCYSLQELEKVWTKKQWTGWIKVLDDYGKPTDIKWGGIC